MGCDGDPNSAFTREVNRHVGCGAASLTVFAHGEWEKAMDLHRGKHSIKDWCKSLKNQVTRAIKDMEPLTSEERKSHRVAKKCHICIKMFKKEDAGDFKMRKVRNHCHYTGKYRGAAHSICNLQYRIPNFIPVVLHNRSKYDDHIYIKELTEEFDSKDFDCIGENTEKYISFAIPIEVGFKDENGNAMQKKKKNKKGEEYEVDLTKTCKLRFIDSFRFTPSSLSSLVNNSLESQTSITSNTFRLQTSLIITACCFVISFHWQELIPMVLSVKVVRVRWKWWKLMVIISHISNVNIAINRLNLRSLMPMY